MKKRQLDIAFPTSGLNRRAAYRQQPPYSTADCLNVRAVDTIAGRARGGSRPGLMQSHIDDLGSSVRLLHPMTLNLGDGFTTFSDTFSGLSMSSAWTAAPWTAVPHLPGVLSSVPAASVDTSVSEGEAILDALTIDVAHPYTVEMLVVPWDGAFHGKYRLYLRVDNAPGVSAVGVMVELVMTGSSGAYTGTLNTIVGATPTITHSFSGTLSSIRPGWFSATVSAANNITVYWCGTEVITSHAAGTQTGTRVGFGLNCTVDGGLCLANVFRVQYYSTGEVNQLRTVLVASAGGYLYYESSYGRLTAVPGVGVPATDLTLNSAVALSAAQDGQSLYIADYSTVVLHDTDGTVSGTTFDDVAGTNWVTAGIDAHDMVVVISNVGAGVTAGTYKIQTVSTTTVTLTTSAGTGTCAYRIERAPKIYDPLLQTLSIHTATALKGQVPTGCPLICRYMNRIVFAGGEVAPHVWYMSRQGDPLDWDYTQEDAQAAVAGTASAAGVPGEAITALAPHSDDYLILGCRNSLWRMRGDPASGGQLDAVSHAVGIMGPKAWCIIPSGELVFLSLDGLYALPPGGDSFPVSLSRDTLPRELLNLNPDVLTVSLEYDMQGRGVHVFLTPVYSNECIHWWLDWNTKSFWPVSLDGDHEPTSTCTLQSTVIEESGIILGGRDGILRRFSDLAEDDCGEAYTSYVVIGPVGLDKDLSVGTVLSLDAVLAVGGGDVTWALSPSLTFEEAVTASSSSTGSWIAGINATDYPACRGQACTLKLTGEAGRKWAMEQVTATIKTGGKRRMP